MPKKLDIVLSQALKQRKLVSSKELGEALQEVDISGESLQQILIERELVPEKHILDIFAEELELSVVDLNTITVPKTVIDQIPVKIASYYKFCPLKIKGRTLKIAVPYPLDIKTQDEIRTQLGLSIEIVLAVSDDIFESLKKYYGLAADTLEKITKQVYSGLDEENLPMPTHEAFQEKVEDIEKLADDASVIKLVNQIILDAIKRRATDIHIEPFRKGVSLRYRIDGTLYEAKIPQEIKNFISPIISRIKIMSSMNIVERRLPQDGRVVVKVQDQHLDLRISTLPTPFGESVVIRILPSKMFFSLTGLGLSSVGLQTFEKLVKKPHGIIFVTGPTGSGKTTTLYACLSEINTKDRNIITIEDPIEYEMEGITQIQVLPDIGLDFARGLRSILRHDPDVIMVGEVRDLETARTAIRVALTGHLIFSTLHTNDAASAITRLIDIGVEPYLVASSVEAFVAQRLVRLICPDCKQEDESVPEGLKRLISRDLGLKSSDIKIYRGKGCQKCNHTGYFGRTAIYEILLVDEAIKELIIAKAPAGQINKVAISKGMRTLRQDGWEKIANGLTTVEEIMKVTSEQENVVSSVQPHHAYISSTNTPDDNPLERRVHTRAASRINITYKVFNSPAELINKGFKPEQLSMTRDISAGGLAFISDELVPIGSIVELMVELPDGREPIDCLARVVRIEELQQKQYSIAICFLDIPNAQKVRLNKYVDKMPKV